MYLGVWEKPEKEYEQQQYHLHATCIINSTYRKKSSQHINDKYNTKFQKSFLTLYVMNKNLISIKSFILSQSIT